MGRIETKALLPRLVRLLFTRASSSSPFLEASLPAPAGYSAKDMKGSGQWDMDLVREVRLHFTAKELKNSGLTAKELKSVDFTGNAC